MTTTDVTTTDVTTTDVTTTDAGRTRAVLGRGFRVLVTGAGGPAGRGLIRQLVDRRVQVLGVDAREVEVAGVRVHAVPEARDPRYLSHLRRLVEECGVAVVVPTVSEELPVLAGARYTLGAEVIVAGQVPVRTADDKFLTARCLATRGVDVPATELASTFDDASTAARAIGSPFVLKPRVSRGSRGVHVVRDGSFPDWHAITDSSVVQEFAPGSEYCVALFVPRIPGSSTIAVGLRKTGLTQGLVGNATAVERLDGTDEDVVLAARAAVEAIGLAGPADVDVRRRADGTPLVLEINARFGANHHVVPEIVDALLTETLAGARGTGSS